MTSLKSRLTALRESLLLTWLSADKQITLMSVLLSAVLLNGVYVFGFSSEIWMVLISGLILEGALIHVKSELVREEIIALVIWICIQALLLTLYWATAAQGVSSSESLAFGLVWRTLSYLLAVHLVAPMPAPKNE